MQSDNAKISVFTSYYNILLFQYRTRPLLAEKPTWFESSPCVCFCSTLLSSVHSKWRLCRFGQWMLMEHRRAICECGSAGEHRSSTKPQMRVAWVNRPPFGMKPNCFYYTFSCYFHVWGTRLASCPTYYTPNRRIANYDIETRWCYYNLNHFISWKY